MIGRRRFLAGIGAVAALPLVRKAPRTDPQYFKQLVVTKATKRGNVWEFELTENITTDGSDATVFIVAGVQSPWNVGDQVLASFQRYS